MGDSNHEFIIRTAVNISPAVIWEFVPDVCCSIDLWKLLPQPQVSESVTDGAASGLRGLVLVPSGAGGDQAQQQRSFLLSASPVLERSLQIWPLHRGSRSVSSLLFLPGLPPTPVQLLYPVSRFSNVKSLQHLCRFCIRQIVRIDHIQELPLPRCSVGGGGGATPAFPASCWNIQPSVCLCDFQTVNILPE